MNTPYAHDVDWTNLEETPEVILVLPVWLQDQAIVPRAQSILRSKQGSSGWRGSETIEQIWDEQDGPVYDLVGRDEDDQRARVYRMRDGFDSPSRRRMRALGYGDQQWAVLKTFVLEEVKDRIDSPMLLDKILSVLEAKDPRSLPETVTPDWLRSICDEIWP